MSRSSVLTITRREVYDTLSDWRVVVPIAILSFVLPLILIRGTALMIRFVDDPELGMRFVPFIVLLVGFVPASFSIVTALESFVGERERNTLEALLSAPTSDRELYISKLTASLVTPLFASYTAMVIFLLLLVTFMTDIASQTLTFTRLFMLFLSIGLMAVTMVSAAVVISSHIGSIRAANLLSSFVLLPMALVVQGKAFLIINNRWDVLWFSVAALAILAVLLIRIGILAFNREEILSREHQQLWTIRLPMFDLLTHRTVGTVTPRARTSQEPVVTIASREIREAITDWRLLLPIAILTFVIPLSIVALTNFAVDFVGDARQIARLVPFIMLMLGFIPASFSLIIALESFVGERERNTLEALFAMPASDHDLYLSKLISSMLVPFFTSYGAILTFGLAYAFFYPELYFVSMTLIRLLQILLIIGAMVVLMVGGAVIISSHTASTRAATLMASFILVPMSVTIMIQSVFIIANRWDMLWIIFFGLVVMAIALVHTGQGTFNREEILSREFDDISVRRIGATFMTFFREYHPAGVSLHNYTGAPFSAMRFYREECPRLLFELRLPILVALIAAVSGLLGGFFFADVFQGVWVTRALDNLGTSPPPSLLLAAQIFANNIRVSILSTITSIVSLGLFAFLVPMVAFLQVGFISGILSGGWFELGTTSPLQFLLAYVIPHGIIELPTFILNAALGIRIGASLLPPPPGFNVGRNMLWALANGAKMWLLVILPLVLFAALIEGLITPHIIRWLY